MPGFWLWFETSATDIPVSWELTVGASKPQRQPSCLEKDAQKGVKLCKGVGV